MTKDKDNEMMNYILLYIMGCGIGASMIISPGPQNIFLLNQGILKNYVGLIAFIYILIDSALICFGAFGFAHIFKFGHLTNNLLSCAAIFVLLYFAWVNLKKSFAVNTVGQVKIDCKKISLYKIMLLTLVFSLVNPSIYFNTVFLIGNIARQLPNYYCKLSLAMGTITVCIIWFYLLTILSVKFSNILKKPIFNYYMNIIFAVILTVLAIYLSIHLVA